MKNSIKLGHHEFRLHASMAEACEVASRLEKSEDVRTDAVLDPFPGGVARGADLLLGTSLQGPNLAARLPLHHGISGPVLSPAQESVPASPADWAPRTHGIAPSPCYASPRATPAASAAPPPDDVNSAITPPQLTMSYRQALLSSSSKPPKPPRRSPAFRPPSSGCFRCLSPSHFVKDCRDPVRCRRCGGFGHRQSSCAMPVQRRLTPHPRHAARPTPAARTGRVASVPFTARTTPRHQPTTLCVTMLAPCLPTTHHLLSLLSPCCQRCRWFLCSLWSPRFRSLSRQ